MIDFYNDDVMKGEFLSFEDIPIGSIWMAADGGSYGHLVFGKDEETRDVLVHAFTSRGWQEDRYDDLIDWHKLQYRYYLVKK